TWYRGIAILNGEVVPVVNPSSFLSRGEVAVLRAITQPVQGVAGGGGGREKKLYCFPLGRGGVLCWRSRVERWAKHMLFRMFCRVDHFLQAYWCGVEALSRSVIWHTPLLAPMPLLESFT